MAGDSEVGWIKGEKIMLNSQKNDERIEGKEGKRGRGSVESIKMMRKGGK